MKKKAKSKAARPSKKPLLDQPDSRKTKAQLIEELNALKRAAESDSDTSGSESPSDVGSDNESASDSDMETSSECETGDASDDSDNEMRQQVVDMLKKLKSKRSKRSRSARSSKATSKKRKTRKGADDIKTLDLALLQANDKIDAATVAIVPSLFADMRTISHTVSKSPAALAARPLDRFDKIAKAKDQLAQIGQSLHYSSATLSAKMAVADKATRKIMATQLENVSAHKDRCEALAADHTDAAAVNYHRRIISAYPQLNMPEYTTYAIHAYVAVLNDTIKMKNKGIERQMQDIRNNQGVLDSDSESASGSEAEPKQQRKKFGLNKKIAKGNTRFKGRGGRTSAYKRQSKAGASSKSA